MTRRLKKAKKVVTLCSMLLAGLLLALPFPASGGQQPRQLVLESGEDAGTRPPEVEVLSDGTLLFKINPLTSVTGDLEGILSERITQVFNVADENGLLPITTFFKLETADGTIEGYYSGPFNHLEDGSHVILQHGEVLSVTMAYVDLYRAEVFYRGTLGADHMSATFTLTISPRPRFR